MHGLINRSFEMFLRDSYGDRMWERLARQAKVDPRGFFLLQNSSDTVTLVLVAEAAKLLRKPAGELVEDLGGWLTRREPIRRLLRFSGRDFPEFVESLGEFPGRAVMVVETIKVPRIRVTAHPPTGYEIAIDSDSAIWPRLLAGVLRGMADDYGALVLIEDGGAVLRVDIALSDHGVMRPFALVPGLAGGMPT